MKTQKSNRFFNLKASWSSLKSLLAALVTLTAVAQAAAQAQSTYDLTIGGYLKVFTERTPDVYDAGFSFYTAAWPLLGNYPDGNAVQTGLYGTWFHPRRVIKNSHYSTIEGGLGWWQNHSFQTATPKYMMGGVSRGNEGWWYANGPGSGSGGGNGIYGAAQLSSSLLFPLDGLNLRQGTSGQLFGFGYLALPLTEPKATTAGIPFPTGNHCWTLFLNCGNFKGPTAFFTPFHWSQAALLHPEWAGETFDSRWGITNKSISMETGTVMKSVAYDMADATYVRTLPSYYPVDTDGYSLLMHRPCVYDQGALWNEVGQWLNTSGPVPRGSINSGSTYVQNAVALNPEFEMKLGGALHGGIDWTNLAAPFAPNRKELGYQWNKNHPSVSLNAAGTIINLPQYYKGPVNANASSSWEPISQASLPQAAATALAGANFASSIPHTPLVAKDNDPVWTSPGPASGPHRALLGDGSVVTYYWYRFADQPAMLKADMTLAERNKVQVTVEKMHRDWKNDRDYLAPPTAGSLADVDPGQLMTPPLGLEYGYVPIAWRQDWGGSVANPGSLNFTAIPASGAPGTPFSVTVRAVNASGVAQNVTSDTLVQLSVGSGYGTLSGTTFGTISNGSSSVTISGISYSAADTMTLTAAATCLASGTSTNLTFTNLNGMVNLYNKQATALVPSSATLNASLDCRGTSADVKVYWGVYNGGISAIGWANSASMGISTNVISTALSRPVTGLLPETTYYFTFSGTNSAGSTWSSKVLSFTTPPLAPAITTQPASSNFVAGSTPKLTVVVAGPVTYQWFKGGVPLTNGGQVAGATSATLSLSNATSGNAGNYSVVITNVTGQVTSITASLTLVPMTSLTWDANGTSAGVTDGAGLWQSNSWWNGTSNVPWIDNNNVQIGSAGAGGVINFGEVMVNNLTLSNFSGNYTLNGGVLTVESGLSFNTSGFARLSGLIRGAGSLTKNGAGSLTVDGIDPNTYSGGTVINGGTLVWGVTASSISPSCDAACGTGPVTVNSNATIEFERANIGNSLIMNGGKLATTNGFGVRWSGPVTVNSTNFVETTTHFDITGNITGPGGFTKTANGVLIFAGNNTYTGATSILAGKIEWQQASAMARGALLVSSGAKANLNYIGARTIQNLTLGGTSMAVGLYGSSASPATYKNDTYFSGPGMLNVGGINFAPVAQGGSVVTAMNRAIPVTLAGTDLNDDAISFIVVSQPTSGTLTGNGANWTYNPATNYIGATSFTFKTNDGLLDSLPATVAITIRQPVFIWKTSVSGNWADDTMWFEGGPGDLADALNFEVTGVYTATRDLSPNFQVNRLNFGGSTVTLKGGRIDMMSQGNVPPTVHQNKNSPILINNELHLGNDTTVTGLGAGNVTLAGLISGSGGLIKNTEGVLKIDGLIPNTYSGGTTINKGLVHLGTATPNGPSPLCVDPAGTGPVTLNQGGVIELDRVTAVNAFTVNGGRFLTPNGFGASLSGPVMLNSSLSCDNSFTLSLSGAVSGAGGIVKTREGLLLLTGSISYSGSTTINGGTLQMDSANTNNDGSTLTIAASGATVKLNFVGTDVVNKLYVGTTQMAAGIYKAVGSAAAGTELAKLTGTGTITVAPSATSTTVVSSFNPAAVGASVTFTSTVMGNSPAGNVTFYAGTTVLGTSALNGSSQAIFTTSSLALGAYNITASYAGDSTNSTSSSTSLSQVIAQPSYSSWASDPAQFATPGMSNGPMDDPDRDGMTNLMEFALGGVPMASNQSILPVLTKQEAGWVFTYNRSDVSLASSTVQLVQYGNDLTGWTTIPIPVTTDGPVTIAPGVPSDRVSVAIPSSGPRTFVRLKVSQ